MQEIGEGGGGGGGGDVFVKERSPTSYSNFIVIYIATFPGLPFHLANWQIELKGNVVYD